MTHRLVVATRNLGKLGEFRALLAGAQLEVVSLAEFSGVVLPEEAGEYEANARAKATAAARGTGLPALADDSGIELAALGGRPGPHSARYGGEGLDDAGRVARLLRELAASGVRDRSARFVCVAALAQPDGSCEVARGECAGSILDAPRGDGGFGYDPVFQPDGYDVSMAELPDARKNELSHRGRALAALRAAIERL